MSVKLFKPNPRNSGCLSSFEFYSIKGERPDFFVTLLPQKTWDANSRSATFNQEGKLIFKLNEFELGSIVYAFNKKVKFSAFHKFGEETTTISVAPMDREPKDGIARPGCFMLNVAKPNGSKFVMPIEYGEFVRLVSYINRFFEALDSHDEAERQKYFSNSPQNSKPAAKTPAPVEAEVPVEPVASEEAAAASDDEIF